MTTSNHKTEGFTGKLNAFIDENIGNEQFGVSELADAIGMSRSNLLRKVKKETNLSVSQFIRNRRLEHALEMLREDEYTISEVAYKVGFGSSSYFIKCFKEVYGYSPGEALNQEIPKPREEVSNSKGFLIYILIGVGIILGIGVFYYFLNSQNAAIDETLEKSIAVLPFNNDSDDASNIHVINGLMESTLNHLQRLNELRVISRTSVEKYRGTQNTIPELAQLLNVNYFVEGSGQKIEDELLITIQLIEAPSDKHLWSKQYRREVKDIFDLQLEISEDIAKQIKVIISPEVRKRIVKAPTESIKAYELYLKGMDQLHQGTEDRLNKAIGYFEEAIAVDNNFALAYAEMSITYYYLDVMMADKLHTDKVNRFADKALLIDPELPEALIAKGFFYLNAGEYDQALPTLEKALEYNPNSARVINALADYYTTFSPNTPKYLEYALKGLELSDPGDSITASYTYLHIANSFIQAGFLEEAKKYIEESLALNPNNLISEYVRSYILFAEHRDLERLSGEMYEVFQKDTTRLDVLQEWAKLEYFKGDIDLAYRLFKAFDDARIEYNLRIFPNLDITLADVYRKAGDMEGANRLIENFKGFCEVDPTMYNDMHWSVYYTYMGDYETANKYLKEFTKQEGYQYWLFLFWHLDPLFYELNETEEFKESMKLLEEKFWKTHEETRANLEKQGLL